jgi:hypothetical protein
MVRIYLGLIVFSIFFAGCSGPRTTGALAANKPIPEPGPYVRITNTDSNRIQLQIAAREFLPARRGWPVIWLTGVSHIGESNYYAQLQAHLDKQTLVLFEGVGSSDPPNTIENGDKARPPDNAPAEPGGKEADQGSLQSAMAAALGLVFQLQAIDYRRNTFRNSDLSISQLSQLMAKQEADSGKPGAKESFQDLLTLMQGNSWLDSLIQVVLRFLGTNPKFQALGRLALMDLIGQLQGDPSRLEGLPPDMKQLLEVLLQRRNEKVIADLKSELADADGGGSVAIFFGTGHMPDLEKRLRRELNYHPKRDLWFTAFDVDLVKSKVSADERAFVDGFVKWQVDEASRQRPK